MNPADWSPDIPRLGSISHSNLAQRRVILHGSYYKHEEYDNVSLTTYSPQTVFSRTDSISTNATFYSKGGERFKPEKEIVYSRKQLPYQNSFTCAQCFRVFTGEIFYQYDDKQYCKYDYQILFAPCCQKCNIFIVGRVIKAMNASWHPDCFRCKLCCVELADTGFIQNRGRAFCYECNSDLKTGRSSKPICRKCNSVIDEQPLRYNDELYHPYHFNCTRCGVELDASARVLKNRPDRTRNDTNKLYCLRCHDKMRLPICCACRRPIEERVVVALGKSWHVEHFACAKCDRPFLGHHHYEKDGQAYCKRHYYQSRGNICDTCNQVIIGNVIVAMNKSWCHNHFACSICDRKMKMKTRFLELDLKPVCLKCYQQFPKDLRDRLRRQYEADRVRKISASKVSKYQASCFPFSQTTKQTSQEKF